MRRTFLVQDYYVKRVGGPHFDVVFEDTGFGPDAVETFDANTLLTVVENAELIVM
jgi:hypothetical protein